MSGREKHFKEGCRFSWQELLPASLFGTLESRAFFTSHCPWAKIPSPFPAPIFSKSLAAIYQDGQSWWLPSFLVDEVKRKVIGGWFTGGHFELIVNMGYVCMLINSGSGLRWLNEEGLLPLGYLWPQFKKFVYSCNSVVWTWP